MRESQKAIEELKKAIKEYYYPATAVKEDSFYSSADNIERILYKAIDLAVEQNLTFDLDVLDNAIPDLVEVCIVHLGSYKFTEALSVFLQIKNAIIMCYFSISKNGFRSELELKQLSEDIKDLKKKKKDLEEQIGLLNHSGQILEGIKQNDRDSLTVIESLKQKQNNVDSLIKEINMQSIAVETTFKKVEDIKAEEEAFIESLENLNNQSTEMIERIKGIFGDVNRDSMASSFKQRRDGLMWGIAFNNIINYLALLSIAALSLYLFFKPIISESQVIDIKFIYERLLIIIPLGFISWFASRRSQYLFQLREDYAYKYASAIAFEGYKRQAEANPEMHDELLKIAITNLGKTPTSIFDRDLKHAPTDKLVDAVKEMLPKTK